eukprot:Phypoly_transcript_04132.p1 GENE.Phypoly_transcript_04132~~Phypoly_transcript_04132.p1  ORF type:complete len:456 (+),score=61.36 Phypoly_transcript_04132:562-1929(+)
MEMMNRKSKSAILEEWSLLSEDTKQRTQAYKHYMKRYRVDLVSQMAARIERREELEEAILEAQVTPQQAQEMRADLAKRESAYLRRRRSRIKFKDFQLLSLIGRGGYGEVYLCRKLDTKEILVLKRMKKATFTANKNELPRVQRERNVLSEAQSPWIIKLKYSFQDETFLYIVMEYAAGGDIKTLLENLGSLDEDMAKFYFAEMLLCVEYLHGLQIIHRDLKPGNFVIDKTGHLKLIDFGLSKAGINSRCSDNFQTWSTMRSQPVVRDRANSMAARNSLTKKKRWGLAHSVVGSPEYMAPEMLSGDGYDERVDLWALGCCLYEFLAGQTPFAADDTNKVFSNVINYQDVIEKPEDMNDEAFDLVKKMLCSADERATMKELKSHPWLKSVDFTNIRQQTSPFVPHLEDEIDTSYFSVDHSVEVDTDSLDSNFNCLLETDTNLQMYFAGFTYKRFDG